MYNDVLRLTMTEVFGSSLSRHKRLDAARRRRTRPAMEHSAAARAGQAQSPFVTGPFLWVTGYVTRVLLVGLVTADEGQVVAEHLVTGTYSRALRPHYGYGARSAHVPLRSSERALRAPSGLVDMPLPALPLPSSCPLSLPSLPHGRAAPRIPVPSSCRHQHVGHGP